jgi:Zn-dependent protease
LAEALAGTIPQIDAPESIYNCPNCSHWLAPGTLLCPECQTIVYSAHLRGVAMAATAEENAGKWAEARDVWKQALLWLPPDTKQYAAVEQRIALVDAKLHSAEARKATWTKRLGPLAPILVFLSKAKWLLILLSKAKFLLSFAGFFALYWALFGWKFGLGFTVGILIHEMGHFVAAKRRGLKVDLPMFLPGLGAYVRWYSDTMGTSLEDRSAIALAGPTFGLLFAAICGGIARWRGETPDTPALWSALAHVGAWLNLLNLIPAFIFDGAKVVAALDRMQRWLVLATTLIFFGMLHEIPFLLVGLGMAWRLWKDDGSEKPHSKTLAHFVLLMFLLGAIMYVFPDPMRRRY